MPPSESRAGAATRSSTFTQFGGGKTHSLLVVYHLVAPGVVLSDLPGVDELLKGARNRVSSQDHQPSGPRWEPNLARALVRQGRRHRGGHLVGELAWQLGGREVYDMLDGTDTNHQPSATASTPSSPRHAPLRDSGGRVGKPTTDLGSGPICRRVISRPMSFAPSSHRGGEGTRCPVGCVDSVLRCRSRRRRRAEVARAHPQGGRANGLAVAACLPQRGLPRLSAGGSSNRSTHRPTNNVTPRRGSSTTTHRNQRSSRRTPVSVHTRSASRRRTRSTWALRSPLPRLVDARTIPAHQRRAQIDGRCRSCALGSAATVPRLCCRAGCRSMTPMSSRK